MAKSTSSIYESLLPTPLKGFIELVADERRTLLAVSTIAAVIDREEDGSLIIVHEHIVGLSGQGGMAYVKKSYDEIIALLKAAQ